MTYFATMNQPMISVVMPAYNCAPYLQEAMDSILSQTYTDFEFVIVNDGSTDNTEAIILTYKDPRIVYVKNEKNMGLVYTLNRGIELSRGVYIARMDGDDISLPDRFSKQIAFFNNTPHAALLAGTIELINEQGVFTGYWEEEKKKIDSAAIRSQLPHDNCIAHPTVMGRAELFKKYGYSTRQKNAEDYDLWLRLAADRVAIYKLDTPLVKHRILQSSFTRQRQKNIFWKNASTKRIFVRGRFGHGGLNGFVLKTWFLSLVDSVKGLLKEIKKVFTRK